MSKFEQYHDTPYQIFNEGEQISVKLTRIEPTVGEIVWNIPSPTGNENTLMYDGALITIDDTPTEVSKQPTDGDSYSADPCADSDNHLGDKLGSAMVVGFLVGDTTTTKIVVTDLDPNKAYYVSLHAISNVRTYHTPGVHSYSVPYVGKTSSDTPARQYIQVGNNELGVQLTDATGLDDQKIYSVDMVLDNDERVTIEIDGSDAQTYQQLIDQWNQIASVADNSFQSPTPPNQDGFFYNKKTQELFKWDGTKYIPQSVLRTTEQPNVVSDGDIWFNPNVPMFYRAQDQSGSIVWIPQTVIDFSSEPNQLDCGTLWYDTTNLYEWTGHAWIDRTIHATVDDPTAANQIKCNAYWFDDENEQLKVLDHCRRWNPTLALLSDVDPTTPTVDTLWLNETDNSLHQFDGTNYQSIAVRVSETTPTGLVDQEYWYNPNAMVLSQKQGTDIVEVDFILWDHNPTQPSTAMLWWNSTTDQLLQWDSSQQQWNVIQQFYISEQDPLTLSVIPIGDVWTADDTNFFTWDGSEWSEIEVIVSLTDPTALANDTLWFDGNKLHTWDGSEWLNIDFITSSTDLIAPSVGHLWMDADDDTLYQYDGTSYVQQPVSTTHLKPNKGFKYFNTTDQQLVMWNGYGWVPTDPKYSVKLADNGKFLILETSKVGSSARIEVEYARAPKAHTMPGVPYEISDLFREMDPPATPLPPTKGGDGLTGQRSYEQLGVGTDGTMDIRRELMDSIRHQLGYPTVQVELTKQQMNYAIDSAIEYLRTRSGMANKLGYQFLDIKPHVQQYRLTDKRIGYNKITSVLKIHRITSSFLSHAAGQGVYGQLALQHLYHMGSFDLISYHMVSQYIETMEHLFATQILFNWNEDQRLLSIYKDLYRGERVLMEVTIERTEQDMMTDRFLKGWIEKYALVQCRLILAEIRGKFGALPGSGGGVSLNAHDLYNRADIELMELYDQIDNYIANDPDSYGMGAHFVLG